MWVVCVSLCEDTIHSVNVIILSGDSVSPKMLVSLHKPHWTATICSSSSSGGGGSCPMHTTPKESTISHINARQNGQDLDSKYTHSGDAAYKHNSAPLIVTPVPRIIKLLVPARRLHTAHIRRESELQSACDNEMNLSWAKAIWNLCSRFFAIFFIHFILFVGR